MSSKFIVSNRVHDPPRDFTSVPACTYINSSGQEFIDMETHQMDIDARDAAYRQEVHNLPLFRICKVSICSLSSALPKRFVLTTEPM